MLLIASVTLSSCGYMSDKPPVNSGVFKTDQLQSCKIDINKLGEIFKADQKEQIRCLQENFIQFTRYVRTSDPGSISETEMSAFIRKFFEGQSDSIVKGLSLIFQLNMLLLRDEATKISRTNISPLFELLVKVNQEAIVITQVLKEMNDAKNQGHFWELREKFNASVTRFSEGTIAIIEKSPGSGQKLNIKEFILEASKKLGSKEIKVETVDSLIFLKSILAGGEKDIITTEELTRIIGKLPKILTLSFDLYYVKNTNFESDAAHSRFYLSNIRDLYSIIEFGQSDFQLFTIDQILSLASDVIKDRDVKKFRPSIIAIKSRLIGGKADSFSLHDLKAILDISHDVSERAYFNLVTYNVYRGLLEENQPITRLSQLELPDQYNVFSKRRVSELHKDFENIAINVRYFRSEKEKIPYYGTLLKRNKYGYLEATLMNWIAGKLLKGYGHFTNGLPQVNEKEFNTFLSDMKPILEEFRLWSPNPATFARNAVLLADLFQNQSNGDAEVNLVEATEYIGMILSAVEISGKFSNNMATTSVERPGIPTCDGGINKDDPVFQTRCFNEHYFDTLLNQLNFKRFFPRLDNYVVNNAASDVEAYLKGVEAFARDNPSESVPVNKRDSVLILGAMLNVESTFIRFDANFDNIIDYKELTEAFKVYQKSIIKLAELTPEQEIYAKSIFLYMVSRMEIPPKGTWLDNVNFYAFHKCASVDFCRERFMDKIEARRLNVGKLLEYIVVESSKAVDTNKKQR
jgi:hypothetical protein